jgi:hypothetical protein
MNILLQRKPRHDQSYNVIYALQISWLTNDNWGTKIYKNTNINLNQFVYNISSIWEVLYFVCRSNVLPCKKLHCSVKIRLYLSPTLILFKVLFSDQKGIYYMLHVAVFDNAVPIILGTARVNLTILNGAGLWNFGYPCLESLRCREPLPW